MGSDRNHSPKVRGLSGRARALYALIYSWFSFRPKSRSKNMEMRGLSRRLAKLTITPMPCQKFPPQKSALKSAVSMLSFLRIVKTYVTNGLSELAYLRTDGYIYQETTQEKKKYQIVSRAF